MEIRGISADKGLVIELAEGVEAEGLPEMLVTLIRRNLEQKPGRLKDFNALNITVGLNVEDLGIKLSLVFEI